LREGEHAAERERKRGKAKRPRASVETPEDTRAVADREHRSPQSAEAV